VAAPTISHLICSMALVALIFVMPLFYSIVVNNVRLDMIRRELKEVTDYVSNTVANLFYLVNSTSPQTISVDKDLLYLPALVENSPYSLKIEGDGGNASKVTATIKDNIAVSGESWLTPGLRITADNAIDSGGDTVAVGCNRNSTAVYVWIRHR